VRPRYTVRIVGWNVRTSRTGFSAAGFPRVVHELKRCLSAWKAVREILEEVVLHPPPLTWDGMPHDARSKLI